MIMASAAVVALGSTRGDTANYSTIGVGLQGRFDELLGKTEARKLFVVGIRVNHVVKGRLHSQPGTGKRDVLQEQPLRDTAPCCQEFPLPLELDPKSSLPSTEQRENLFVCRFMSRQRPLSLTLNASDPLLLL